LKYQIFNAFPFEDGTEILKILAEETKDWDNESVNELYLSYDPETITTVGYSRLQLTPNVKHSSS